MEACALVTWGLTQRGKDKLIDVEGNSYTYNSKNKNSALQYWVCSNRRCSGRFKYFVESKTGCITVPHLDGENNPIENRRMDVMTIIKKEAKSNTLAIPNAIVNKVLQTAPLEVQAILPTENSLKDAIRRWRKATDGIKYKEPKTRDEIVVNGLVDPRGESMIMYDSKDKDRLLIFATEKNLKELSMCRTWLCDGTFKTVPTLYYQLYTIHGLDDKGWALPYVYALLPGKTTTIYEKLFSEVETACGKIGWPISPEVIILDFELAAIRAIVNVFPNVSPQGCLFHFANAHRKNYPSSILKCTKESPSFSLYMRGFTALAFLPIHEVEISFRDHVSKFDGATNIQADFKKFVEYFQNTYIGSNYSPPLFPPKFWNVRERVLENIPRTNNFVEGWNNRFRNLVSCYHPSFYKFLTILAKEQDRTNRMLVRKLSHPNKPSIYRKMHANIRFLVSTYDQYTDRNDFLKGLSVYVCNFRTNDKKKKNSED